MAQTHFTTRHGELIAAALAGAWRRDTAPCALTAAELCEITPLLLKSGAAALVWWRLSRAADGDAYALLRDELQRAYKLQTLEAAVHEHHVREVFRLLAAARIEALLVKGWAAARAYPEPGLRHYGDIDLCVRAADYERAAAVLSRAPHIWIDLHEGTAVLDGAGDQGLFARSVLVEAGDVHVRVPSAEDHLRVLCLHLLRHGAWKPLWLCDVALMLEGRAADFDWQLFFGRDGKRAGWLACVLALAHRLLGARLEGTPVVVGGAELPRWLVRAVLRRWGRWFNADYRDRALPSLWKHRRDPRKLLDDLYFRFDPVRATVEARGSFNTLPRFPYQLTALLRRAPELPRRLFSLLPDRN
jgi:putative nucleotidyltransferase-like protein